MAADGRPVLGPNKTWRGLVAGALAGALSAGMQAWLAQGPWVGLDYGRSSGHAWWAIGAFGALLGVAALAGDAAKSYLKRRRGRGSGSSWFPLDQLDFVAGGLAGAFLASPLLPGWAMHTYFGDGWVLFTLVMMTPGLHLLSSVAAYWVGLKKVPW